MRFCAFDGCGIATRYAEFCAAHHKQNVRGEQLRPLAPRTARPRALVPHPTDPTAFLVPLGGGGWAVIDAADADAVGRFNWTARKQPNGLYAYRRIHGDRPRTVDLHRFIAERAGLDMSREIDHRNLNPSDNRRRNLRAASKSQQRCNQGRDSRNTSGVKGVHWNGSRWVAQIAYEGKHYYLGTFSDKDEAAAVVDARRRELHGEFANDGNGILQ